MTTIVLGKFIRQHIKLFDGGWLREKVGGFLEEGSGDLAREVGLAACFVGKSVEDAER